MGVRSVASACWGTAADAAAGAGASLRLGGMWRLLARSQLARKRLIQTFLLNAPLLAVGVAASQDVLVRGCHAAARLLLPVPGLAAALAAAEGPDAAGATTASAVATIRLIDGGARAAWAIAVIIPYFLVAAVVSGLWAAQLSAEATRLALGGGSGSGGTSPSTTPAAAAPVSPWQVAGESVYRALIVAGLNLASVLLDASLTHAFVVGRALPLGLYAVTCAYTAYDVAWSAAGTPLRVRQAAVEAHWAWFMGFGALTAAASFFFSPVINGAAYAIMSPWVTLVALTVPLPTSPRAAHLPLLAPIKWAIYAVVVALPPYVATVLAFVRRTLAPFIAAVSTGHRWYSAFVATCCPRPRPRTRTPR